MFDSWLASQLAVTLAAEAKQAREREKSVKRLINLAGKGMMIGMELMVITAINMPEGALILLLSEGLTAVDQRSFCFADRSVRDGVGFAITRERQNFRTATLIS